MFPGIISNVAPTVTSSSSSGSATLIFKPEEDNKAEAPEKHYNESFSRSILARHFEEYKAGKYTTKYMEAYLNFMHLSGYIDNLEYLEYQQKLVKE